jgi:hypothetical protein
MFDTDTLDRNIVLTLGQNVEKEYINKDFKTQRKKISNS